MAEWKRRQAHKGRPFWVYENFEIIKLWDCYQLIDIEDYQLLAYFVEPNGLKKAKDFAEKLIKEK